MGFALTSLGGTFLHFLYELSGSAVWTASFSGINESTWEHMKLFFWPAFVYSVIESIFFRDRADFWCVKLKGTLLGLSLIPLLFYTYNGVIGKSPDWINIAIFFVAAAIAYAYETRKLKKEPDSCKSPKAAFLILCAIAVLFILFTFATPKLNIFKDPLTNTYRIQ